MRKSGLGDARRITLPHAGGEAMVLIWDRVRPDEGDVRARGVILEVVVRETGLDQALGALEAALGSLVAPEATGRRLELPAAFCGRLEAAA